jgi:hypothetical protein
MLKFSKSYGQVLFFILSFFVVANCYALTGTVTVKVSPGHQTVKTRVSGSTEVIGTNTAEYAIKAECDPKPRPNEEVKAVEPSWSITSSAAFVPPQGIIPVPTNPGDPSVNTSGSGGNWTAKVQSPNAGQWEITFTVKVVYKLKNSITDKYIYNPDGTVKTQEFTGTGSCTFKSTNATFKIEIKPSDDFIGNRSNLGIGEPAKVVVSEWKQNDPKVTFVSMYATGTNTATPPTATLTGVSSDGSNPSGSPSFTAGDYAGSATITVNVTIDGTAATDSIGITVIEPSGAVIIQHPNTFKRHEKNEDSVGFIGTSYYLPNTVSFWKVSFREGSCRGEGKGFYKRIDGLVHPEDVNHWLDCSKGISQISGQPNTENSADEIWTGTYGSPYSDGTFDWPIPWYFKCGSHQGNVTTVNHCQSINTKGDTTISKGGTTKFAAFGDRDSVYTTGPDK